MDLTRRQFVLGSVAGIGSVVAPAFKGNGLSSAFASEGAASSSFSTLNSIGYGPTPELQERLAKLGLKRYLEEQFHPVTAQDTVCNQKLANATLHIEYNSYESKLGDKNVGSYPAVKEDRPLLALGAPIEDLWKLTQGTSATIDGKERVRPAQEVRAATWIRAIYSKWQLREVMVEFWHNHFSVHAFSDNHIAPTMPIYDSIMRKNCFGNFRAFLEEVAKSTAMQFYLNNVKSKASPANENYARELFELHTLGADHYYNDLYNRWREVPGAVKGRPIGYIDQDVYEAARAFTGWTIEDGTNTGRGTIFPQTGKFVYFDGWHDNYQKRVLGNEFDPNSPPMADGRKVLDLIAAHPGTAMYLATKLCRRLVADNPPPSLVKKAAQVWQKAQHQPDQIKQVLETILLSPEFAHNEKKKVKRPFEYAVSFLRATQADFMPREEIFNRLTAAGHRQFDWPTPTGNPDVSEYWLNTNTTLSCWNLVADLSTGGFNKAAIFDLAAQTPSNVKTLGEIISYWVKRMTGKPADEVMLSQLMQYMPKPHDVNTTPNINSPDFKEPLQQMVIVIAMSPDFQVR